MHIFFVSSFVGNFLPSIGGDVYRAYQLAQLGVRSGEAAASVLMDRIVGVLSMVMVAAVALLFLRELESAGRRAGAADRDRRLRRGGGGRVQLEDRRPDRRLVQLLPVGAGALGRANLLDAIRRYASHHGALALVLAPLHRRPAASRRAGVLPGPRA